MALNEREQQLNGDYEWALHDAEVQRQQAGQVVAVHRRRIVAVGPNHREALQAALRQPSCPPREEITLVFVEGRPVRAG
jgi:hypothetical protein